MFTRSYKFANYYSWAVSPAEFFHITQNRLALLEHQASINLKSTSRQRKAAIDRPRIRGSDNTICLKICRQRVAMVPCSIRYVFHSFPCNGPDDRRSGDVKACEGDLGYRGAMGGHCCRRLGRKRKRTLGWERGRGCKLWWCGHGVAIELHSEAHSFRTRAILSLSTVFGGQC